MCHCSAAPTAVFTVCSLCDSRAENRYPPAIAYATVSNVRPTVDSRNPATRLHNSAHCHFRFDMRADCSGGFVSDNNDDDDDDDIDGVSLAEAISTSAGSSCPPSCDMVSVRSSQTAILRCVTDLRLCFRYAGNNRKLTAVSLSALSMVARRDVMC